MKKDSTSISLFCFALSCGLTGALLAFIKWLGAKGYEDLSQVVFQRNPSSILAIFFGVYCGSMIFYIAARKRNFPSHFRLLLFYCAFPIVIGLVGSMLGGDIQPASAETLSPLSQGSNTSYYPFYIGTLASLIDIIALITVYRSKEIKRSKV